MSPSIRCAICQTALPPSPQPGAIQGPSFVFSISISTNFLPWPLREKVWACFAVWTIRQRGRHGDLLRGDPTPKFWATRAQVASSRPSVVAQLFMIRAGNRLPAFRWVSHPAHRGPVPCFHPRLQRWHGRRGRLHGLGGAGMGRCVAFYRFRCCSWCQSRLMTSVTISSSRFRGLSSGLWSARNRLVLLELGI